MQDDVFHGRSVALVRPAPHAEALRPADRHQRPRQRRARRRPLARFVRINQWVDAYVANEGVIDGESARVLRVRRRIDAQDVAIFAAVRVQHGSHAIVGESPVAEQASDVEFADADVATATGNRTGDAVPEGEIAAVRSGTRLSLIAGSGVTFGNASQILGALDGAIVGSSLKEGASSGGTRSNGPACRLSPKP